MWFLDEAVSPSPFDDSGSVTALPAPATVAAPVARVVDLAYSQQVKSASEQFKVALAGMNSSAFVFKLGIQDLMRSTTSPEQLKSRQSELLKQSKNMFLELTQLQIGAFMQATKILNQSEVPAEHLDLHQKSLQVLEKYKQQAELALTLLQSKEPMLESMGTYYAEANQEALLQTGLREQSFASLSTAVSEFWLQQIKAAYLIEFKEDLAGTSMDDVDKYDGKYLLYAQELRRLIPDINAFLNLSEDGGLLLQKEHFITGLIAEIKRVQPPDSDRLRHYALYEWATDSLALVKVLKQSLKEHGNDVPIENRIQADNEMIKLLGVWMASYLSVNGSPADFNPKS